MQKIRAVRRSVLRCAILLSGLALLGCSSGKDASLIGNFRMGEKVQAGSLEYTVLESEWKTALAEGGRAPANRFLFLRVSITNKGSAPIAVPGFELRGPGDKMFQEVTENMQDVPDWLGLLRNVAPSQTLQGRVVFDAPIAAYKLAVSDGADIGSEKYALIDIPVHID